MNTTAHIIASREAGPFKPAVVLGQDLPNEINGQPVAYFWKEMLPVGAFRDVNGKAFVVPPARVDTLIQCFNRAKAKGYRPFLPAGSHKERQKNYGFLQDVRKGSNGSLEGLHQFIGEDAIREAARNKSSICTLQNVRDEHGEHYDELIDHNAILPDPQLSGLGDFVPFNPALAASRGQPISADVLELTASTKESDMDLTALRKAIGAEQSVPDADVIAQATTKLGTIPTLESAKVTAETALTEAKTELSRRPAPASADPFPAAVAASSVNLLSREIELMAREGSISGEQATAAKALLGTADKPNTLMLSREGANHPAEAWFKVLALGKSGVVADGKSKTGDQVLDRQTHDHSAATNLSRETGTTDPAAAVAAARQEGQQWQQQQLANRGLAASA